MNRSFWVFFLWVFLCWAPSGQASNPFGDEDYYPVGCVDLSGRWKSTSNAGKLLDIRQAGCRGLQIRSEENQAITDILDIDPNGKTYSEDCKGCTTLTRGRWDSVIFGAVLETYRETSFEDRRVIDLVNIHKVRKDRLLVQAVRYILKNSDDSFKRLVSEEWYVHE